MLLLLGAAVSAQAQTVVIQGRVEDAASRQPLGNVTVFSSDSSSAAVTDSLGLFALRVSAVEPFTVLAERLGYLPTSFELPEGAASLRSVLLLEREPIAVEGIHVVGESAVTETIEDLDRRRNAYAGSVSAFDRARLERLAPFGSAWDFVRRRAYYVFPCSSSMSGLCSREMRGRRSVRFAPSENPVTVCIDGRESWGAVGELTSLDIESVALVEIYRQGRSGIRVYTPGYIATSARIGRNIAAPLRFGC